MKKIKEWTGETIGAILIILGLIVNFLTKKKIVEEEQELDIREKQEEQEEEKLGELIKKKREIIIRLSNELGKVKETSQIYTSEKIMNYIFGEEGLKGLNKKLEGLDEKLMKEKKKDIEELKEVSGLLRADEEELREKGIVLNKLHGIENKIIIIQEEMEGLFELFDDRIKEENKILEDKNTFKKVLENGKNFVKHFKELNQIIIDTRKNLRSLEHGHIKSIWEERLMKKIDEINEMSISIKERKDLVTYIRKNFINPVKQKLKGKDTSWLEKLEINMIAHEHTKKAIEWESKLEQAVWDLSDEMRKEWFIHKHLERAFKIIDEEMKKLENMIGHKEKIAA